MEDKYLKVCMLEALRFITIFEKETEFYDHYPNLFNQTKSSGDALAKISWLKAPMGSSVVYLNNPQKKQKTSAAAARPFYTV
jgi:hypothetical protein